jgi:hypothetical protein
MSSSATGAPVVASDLPVPPECTPESAVAAAVSRVSLSPSGLSVDEFAHVVEGLPLRFVLTHLDACLMVWVGVGDSAPSLPHLALGMNSR